MERLAGRAPRGLGWRLAAVGVLALSASAMSVGALAAFPPSPGLPFSQSPNRSVEPVVLTGSQFPGWSAGPEFTAHAPMSPFNSSTVGQQASEPQQLQSDCYDAQGATYSDGSGYKDNGDHNCYQASQLPVRTLPGRTGADPRRLLGYRWDGHQFVQIPFQVDQVFARYISNNASGFAFYSGTDQQTDYAYDREGFRFLASEAPYSATDTSIPPQVCVAVPFDDRKNNPRSTYDGQATTPSPNGWHLVDKDELSFMARDAGVQAPQGAPAPAGIVDSYQVTVTDPANGSVGFVYVMLGGGNGPAPAYTAANSPYVHYQRDANAGMFVYSQSSYSGYGAAPKGYYCNLDGTLAFDPKTGKPAVGQRRPLDKAWVYTPRYAFRYDGRWLMTEIHVAPKGHDARITNKGKGQPSGLNLDQYGPNIVDRWKARAFQQSPGGDTPCCGYEEEATNWGGSSILLGERTGPVRVIRATWGADSSTNNIRREIFYADQVRYQDFLRVHVIPPLDGIYVQRDMAAGVIDTYYNPYQSQGVPVAGINEEVYGNIHAGLNDQGFCYSSQDQVGSIISGLTGGKPIVVSPGGGDPCNSGGNGFHGDFDVPDSTFSGPVGSFNWEELTGTGGTVVERWTAKTDAPAGTALSTVASQPYYRDDSCFDDGTGNDPGPKLHLRHKDEPQVWWYDPTTGQPTTTYWVTTGPNTVEYNATPPAGVTTYRRRCWNHHVDSSGGETPYNIPGTASYDASKAPDTSDPPPNPQFSSLGDIRYFQGDIGTHGLHVEFVTDSDNAQLTVPVDEIDSEQLQVILPGHAANKPAVNVGEAYGRSFEQPLVATASPMSLQFPAAARPVTAARPVAAPVPARVAGASRVAMPAPDRRRDDTRGLLAVGAGLAVLTGLALLKPLLLGLKP